MDDSRDDSIDLIPVELLRDAFKKCIKDLVEKTKFESMYNELCSTAIGKSRMYHVFVLRAGPEEARDEQFSHELYNGILKEHDEHFLLWFKTIRDGLSRTGNENNGNHSEVAETISNELHLLKEKPYDKIESDNTVTLQLLSKKVNKIC